MRGTDMNYQVKTFLNSLKDSSCVVDVSVPGAPAATKTKAPSDVIDWFGTIKKDYVVTTYIPGKKIAIALVENIKSQFVFSVKSI